MLAGLARNGPVVLVFEDLHQADPLLLDLIEQLVKEARRVPLLVRVRRALGLPRGPAELGGRASRRGDAVGRAARRPSTRRGSRWRRAVWSAPMPSAWPPMPAATRCSSSRSRACSCATSTTVPPVGAGADRPAVARDRAGGDRGADRPAVAGGARAGPARLGVPARPVRHRRAVADRRAQPGAAGRGGGRGAPAARRGAPGRVAVPQRRAARRRLRLARQARAAAAAPAGRRQALRAGARGSLPADDRLPPGAGGARARSTWTRTIGRSPTGRSTRSRGRATRRGGRSSRARPSICTSARSRWPATRTDWGVREAWIVGMLGEARYWLADFDEAETRFRKAMTLAAGDDRVVAHAARFLADITLTIRGDDHLAASLFDRSLDAARRLGDPFVLARTLLMAGWVPFWRNRLDEAEALFREALDVVRDAARTGRVGGGARAGRARERDVAPRRRGGGARDRARGARRSPRPRDSRSRRRSPTSVVAASSRRMLRLEDAVEHADAAVRILRELGARWELASVLGDRGATHRVAGRLDAAELDLREAFVLCRDLKERALVTWTASELARTLAGQGDVAGARVGPGRSARAHRRGRARGSDAPWRSPRPLRRWPRGTRSAPGAIARGARGRESPRRCWRTRAPPPSGGSGASSVPTPRAVSAAIEDAREQLERNGWRQALREPELVTRPESPRSLHPGVGSYEAVSLHPVDGSAVGCTVRALLDDEIGPILPRRPAPAGHLRRVRGAAHLGAYRRRGTELQSGRFRAPGGGRRRTPARRDPVPDQRQAGGAGRRRGPGGPGRERARAGRRPDRRDEGAPRRGAGALRRDPSSA